MEDDEGNSLVCVLSLGQISTDAMSAKVISSSIGNGDAWLTFGGTPGDVGVGAVAFSIMSGDSGERASLRLRRFGIDISATVCELDFCFGGRPRLAAVRR
jgi:phosphoribosylformylglycinamidine (FGAM) synthase-like enzyme